MKPKTKSSSDSTIQSVWDPEDVDVVETDIANPVEMLSKSDARFLTYVERMKGARRGFISKKHGFVTWEFYDDDDDAIQAAIDEKEQSLFDNEHVSLDEDEKSRVVEKNTSSRELWMAMAAKQFIRRKTLFDKEMSGSRFGFITAKPFLLVALMLLSGLLFFYWPVWDHVLIDVQADTYYTTLELQPGASKSEVKKAYRSMTKKWHPDKNPDCGAKCRNMMMQIQEAHDVLMERGSSEKRMELLRKYQESLQHLVSLIFVRGFGMARSTADYFAFLVKWVYHKTALGTVVLSKVISHDTLSISVRLGFLVVFGGFVVVFVTAHPFILLEFFYFAVHMYQPNPAQQREANVVRRSNFDVSNDSKFIIAPAVILHAAHFLLYEKYPRYDQFAFQLVMGFTYIAAHLTTYTPNLFDNVVMMKCSVPWPYLSKTNAKVGKHGASSDSFKVTTVQVLFTEFLILLNDIWAFSVQIPGIYRAVVLLVHCLFWLQFAALPWDAPILGRLQRRSAAKQKVSKHERTDQSLSSKYTEDHPLTQVTEKEEELVSSLDKDSVAWSSTMSLELMSALQHEEKQLPKPSADADASAKTKLQLFFHCELRHVIVATVTPASKEGTNPTVVERCRIQDHLAATTLAREFGPNAMWPEPSLAKGPLNITQQKAQMALQTTHQRLQLVPFWNMTVSGARRSVLSQTFYSPGLVAKEIRPSLLRVLKCMVFVSVVAILGFLPGPMTPVFNKHFPPLSLSPNLRQRFRGLLESQHILNQPFAGALALNLQPLSIFVVDKNVKTGKNGKQMADALLKSNRLVSCPFIEPDLFEALRSVTSSTSSDQHPSQEEQTSKKRRSRRK